MQSMTFVVLAISFDLSGDQFRAEYLPAWTGPAIPYFLWMGSPQC